MQKQNEEGRVFSAKPGDGKRINTSKRIVRILLSIPFICLFALVLLEYFPIYIKIPILPPEDHYGVDDWRIVTSMIRRGLGQRSYLWRLEAWFINDEELDYRWDQIVDYFDDALAAHDWIRGDENAPEECGDYLSEIAFLEYGLDGYVHYRKTDYEYSQDFYKGDMICLVVWPTNLREDEFPEVYTIILLTSRPSPFTILLEIIS